MSLINTKIKNFNNIAFKKNKFITITEKDILGQWSVFFFYPADFTFVCPTELEDLSDYYEEFKKRETEIYSISTDTHFSHKEWHDNSKKIKKIKYTMIGDPHWTLTKNFDVMQKKEDKELGLSNRATFIINPKGKIKWIEITVDGIGRDAQFVLNKIKSLQYIAKNPKEVCPAKWNTEKKTIIPNINLVGKI